MGDEEVGRQAEVQGGGTWGPPVTSGVSARRERPGGFMSLRDPLRAGLPLGDAVVAWQEELEEGEEEREEGRTEQEDALRMGGKHAFVK